MSKFAELNSSITTTCRGLTAASISTMDTAIRPRYVDLVETLRIYTLGSIIICAFLAICGCTPVKQTITNRYTLSSYSSIKTFMHHHGSLFISPTEAVDSYQTDAMLYQDRPFEIRPFAYHAWQSNPSSMIYPLIYQSLQESRVFHAIVTGPYAWQTDYRLDTQLIQLVQNFQVKPSQLLLTMKASLTKVSNNRVIASYIWHIKKPCPADTPAGGVYAANQATKQFTYELSRFVEREIHA